MDLLSIEQRPETHSLSRNCCELVDPGQFRLVFETLCWHELNASLQQDERHLMRFLSFQGEQRLKPSL